MENGYAKGHHVQINGSDVETPMIIKPEPIKQPPSTTTRCIVLICVCIMIFCSYNTFNSISALQLQLEKGLHITPDQIGTIYAVYSVPNTVMVLFGGIIFDKLGVRSSTLLFLTTMLIGTFLTTFAIGPFIESYYLLLTGRLIYGLGSESAYVAFDSITAMWWDGPYLALGMGFTGAAGQAANILSYAALPVIASQLGYMWTMWLCAVGEVIGFITAIIFVVVTYLHRKSDQVTVTPAGGSFRSYHSDSVNQIQRHSIKKVKSNANYRRRVRRDGRCLTFLKTVMDEIGRVSKDIRNFSLGYWLVTGIVVAYYAVIFTFISFAPYYLHKRYGFSEDNVGFVVALISATSVVTSPLLGFLLDRWGKRGFSVLVSSVGLCLAFAIFGWVEEPHVVYGCMALIGFAFSLVASALWPCIAYLVDEAAFGTAFGIMGAGINTFSLVMDYSIGYLLADNLLFVITMMWLGLAGLALALSVWWNIVDWKSGGLSQLPSAVIQQRLGSKDEKEEDQEEEEEEEEEEDKGLDPVQIEKWIVETQRRYDSQRYSQKTQALQEPFEKESRVN